MARGEFQEGGGFPIDIVFYDKQNLRNLHRMRGPPFLVRAPPGIKARVFIHRGRAKDFHGNTLALRRREPLDGDGR